MELQISDNPEKKRFETEMDNKVAFIEYTRVGDKLYLTHTEVPPAIEGNGVGSALVRHALKAVENEDRKLVPLCPFVVAYLKKHPEDMPPLAKGYHI